jgi:CheY-like chemotaxis protein
LQLVAAEREGIDLVILDMVLPDMDGSAIFDRLRELVPDIKVLLASGYSVDERARAILARGCRAFIQKPYSLEGLANKVREVLDCGAGLAS